MAELSLRERLQPALLDRLTDDERLLTLFEVTAQRDALEKLALSARDFAQMLKSIDKLYDLVLLGGLNHFEVGSALGAPESHLFSLCRRFMDLNL